MAHSDDLGEVERFVERLEEFGETGWVRAFRAWVKEHYGHLACGLRLGEAISLPVSAVDSKQMLLHIIGKGNKERVVPLSEPVLQMLREVWKTHRNPTWLFPRRNGQPQHVARSTMRKVFDNVRHECLFDDKFTMHTLRHSFATHLLERRIDTRSVRCNNEPG